MLKRMYYAVIYMSCRYCEFGGVQHEYGAAIMESVLPWMSYTFSKHVFS